MRRATALRRRSCNARRSECVRLSYAFPLCRRLWGTPPVFAKRRRSEGYALKDAHTWLACAEGALENAGVDPYLATLVAQRTLYVARQGLTDTHLAAALSLVALYVALGGDPAIETLPVTAAPRT